MRGVRRLYFAARCARRCKSQVRAHARARACGRTRACVCARAYVCARACVRSRAPVRACTHVRARVGARVGARGGAWGRCVGAWEGVCVGGCRLAACGSVSARGRARASRRRLACSAAVRTMVAALSESAGNWSCWMPSRVSSLSSSCSSLRIAIGSTSRPPSLCHMWGACTSGHEIGCYSRLCVLRSQLFEKGPAPTGEQN
eukprot:5727784-Pleurochrysis_carterae.AAC.2